MVNCGIHIATPYPGTKLYQMCREKGYLIHENTERRLMLPGDIHIATEDFAEEDIIYRAYRMRLATGILPDFESGMSGFIRWKIRPILSKIGLDPRKYVANIPDNELEGFYAPEIWLDVINYRWTSADASIKVNVPEHAKTLDLFTKSNRPHSIRVYLNDVMLGELAMKGRWTVHSLPLPENYPTGEVRLRFKSDTMIPADEGFNNDTRSLGFILSWHEFHRKPVV